MKIDGPRITVQYEITGDETDKELVQMKRTEKSLEEYFAKVWLHLMEKSFNPNKE